MTRYYFNLYNDVVTTDDEGAELDDDGAAYRYAVKAVRALAADSVLKGQLTGSHYIEVVDENRNRLATVRFDEAVELLP